MNVVPDVFPSDWFLETVKDALGEFEEQDTEDDEDDTENDSDEDTGDDEDSDDEGVVKLEDDEDDTENDSDEDTGSDQRRAMSAGGRGSEGSPRESLVRRKRFVRYGGRRFLIG